MNYGSLYGTDYSRFVISIDLQYSPGFDAKLIYVHSLKQSLSRVREIMAVFTVSIPSWIKYCYRRDQ